MADSEPGWDRMAALHPAKDPRDGAQAFKSAILVAFRNATCWARANAGVFKLIDRRGLLEVFEHLWIFGDVFPVVRGSISRHRFHGLVPALLGSGGGLRRHRDRLKAGRHHDF